MNNVIFNAENHVYTVDGIVLPSVTQILSAVGVTYYYDTGNDTPMTKGSYVHEAIKLWHEKNLDESSLDDTIKPYFLAYQNFEKLTGFVAEKWEIPSCHKELGYAGMFDVIGQLSGKRVLIDYKTGQIDETACRLQTAAYANMTGIGKISARYALQLKTNADFRLSKAYTNLLADFNSFIACKHVYDIQCARIKDGKIERV